MQLRGGFSRCVLSYLYEILKVLTFSEKSVEKYLNIGYNNLLEFDNCRFWCCFISNLL